MKQAQGPTIKSIGETLKDLGKTTASETAKAVKDIAVGSINQLLGVKNSPENNPIEKRENKDLKKSAELPKRRKKFETTIFRWSDYREQVVIKRRIQELINEIRAETEAIKKTTSSITAEVQEIEKATLENLPEKVGIYHVRFLEVILKLIKSLRAKVSESKVWLEALLTRKKKRGSLFLALSKKKGTQYSLSEELKLVRNVQ